MCLGCRFALLVYLLLCFDCVLYSCFLLPCVSFLFLLLFCVRIFMVFCSFVCIVLCLFGAGFASSGVCSVGRFCVWRVGDGLFIFVSFVFSWGVSLMRLVGLDGSFLLRLAFCWFCVSGFCVLCCHILPHISFVALFFGVSGHVHVGQV